MRLPGTEAIVFPNGVTLDQRGNIYVTDMILGAVWRVPAGGGPAEPWFQSPLLLGSGIFEFGFPLGANGIAFRQNGARRLQHGRWAAARDRHQPGRNCGVRHGARRRPGPPCRRRDRLRRAWQRLGGGHRAKHDRPRVPERHRSRTVATALDGLDWASSIAFGKDHDLWASTSRSVRRAGLDPRSSPRGRSEGTAAALGALPPAVAPA